MIPLAQALKAEPDSRFLKAIHGWLIEFICDTRTIQNVVGNRHKDDGSLVSQEEFDRKDRAAQVCPFVGDSIDKGQFWVERSELTRHQTPQIAVRLNELISEFVSTPPEYDPRVTGKPAPRECISKCLLLYFQNFGNPRSRDPIEEIEQLYRAFKPQYMIAGLGLGRFYPGCPVGGVYSSNFRAVGPVPAFGVRYLAKHDTVFDPIGSKFRGAYEKFFPKMPDKKKKTKHQSEIRDLKPKKDTKAVR